jgi:hypothetical protein
MWTIFIIISIDVMAIIEDLRKTHVLKGVGVLEYYLGGNYDSITDPAVNIVSRPFLETLQPSYC